MTELTGNFRDCADAHKSVSGPMYSLIKIYFLDMYFLLYENKIVTKFVMSGVLKPFPSRTSEFNSTISFYHQNGLYLNIKPEIVKNLPNGLNYTT